MGSRVSARSRAGKARAAAAVVEVARNERRSMLTSLGAATLDLSSVFVNALVDHDGRAGKAPHRSIEPATTRSSDAVSSVSSRERGGRQILRGMRRAGDPKTSHCQIPMVNRPRVFLRRRKLSPRLYPGITQEVAPNESQRAPKLLKSEALVYDDVHRLSS